MKTKARELIEAAASGTKSEQLVRSIAEEEKEKEAVFRLKIGYVGDLSKSVIKRAVQDIIDEVADQKMGHSGEIEVDDGAIVNIEVE